MIIDELDWEPALETYKALVNTDCGTLPESEFMQVATQHPFGIYREDREDVVRDPFGVTDEEALVCLSKIPQNSLLYVLKGDAEALNDAAREVAQEVAISTSVRQGSIA
jgi:hypothetical protein